MLGRPRTHGRMTVDPTLFKRGGRYAGGYIALRDLPEFGIRAGQEVSRRKGIEVSHGGKRIEELVEKRGWRRDILRRAYRRVYGSDEGFNALIDKLDRIWPTTSKGLPFGFDNQRVATRWQRVLEKAGLWEDFQDDPNFDEFWGSEEPDVDLLDYDAWHATAPDESEDVEYFGFGDMSL